MLRDSVVVRTRPRAIPLAMITITKILHGFPFLSHDDYGAPLGGPSGRRSPAINTNKIPGARFSKAPKTFRARKAIAKSRTLRVRSCFIHIF